MRFLPVLLIALLPLSCIAEPVPEFADAMEEVQHNFELADRAVDETFHLIIQKIDAGEYDDYMVSISVLDEGLVDSQSAWEKYREVHCYGVRTMMSGGTSENIDYLECLTALNKTREQELRDLYLHGREDSHSVTKTEGDESGLWDLAPD